MDVVSSFSGVLVGATSNSYKAFRDREGSEVAGGTKRTLYLSCSFGTAPMTIKVPAQHETTFDRLAALGFGAPVEVLCTIRAFNNEMGLTLADVVRASAPANSKPAPARA